MPSRGIHNQSPQNNWATLDHLRTRLQSEHDEYGMPLPGSRYEPNFSNEERTVLCCWLCNNIRGILTQIATEDLSFAFEDGIWKLQIRRADDTKA